MVTFYIEDSSEISGWLDMTQYWAFETLKEDENDVDGPAVGRALNGLMIRDKVSEKEKFFFESIYMPIPIAWHIKALARRESFLVKTNLKTGTDATYRVHCGNRTLGYKLAKDDGTEYVKLSFNMIEL